VIVAATAGRAAYRERARRLAPGNFIEVPGWSNGPLEEDERRRPQGNLRASPCRGEAPRPSPAFGAPYERRLRGCGRHRRAPMERRLGENRSPPGGGTGT
jgi:hypothetical protein